MKHSHTLIGKLMDLIQETAQNAEYPEFFLNERCLVDPNTYLNLCKYIFPEVIPNLNEIQSLKFSPADKINLLLDLLSEVLQIDFSHVDGTEITRFNLSHIQSLVVFLYQNSKIIRETAEHPAVCRSQKSFPREPDPPIPQSARGPSNKEAGKGKPKHHRQKNLEGKHKERKQHRPKEEINSSQASSDEEKHQIKHVQYADREYLLPAAQESVKKKKTSKYSSTRKQRNQRLQRQNLHQNIVTTIMKEKTRTITAEKRDNRKNKMQFMEEEKQNYKAYLMRYVKQNRAKNNRQSALAIRSATAVRPLKQQLPKEDFEKIDCFFQSFAYRFRDTKAAYLRKISQLVRKQEIDRFCYHNRIERETKKYMEERLDQQLAAARHQHRVKSEMLRESASQLENQVSLMKKEEIRIASAQKRELKEDKKNELKQIESVLKQDNDRVLMSFQDGGRLEQIIMKMYKKL